ncbi:aspartyl-phosphate phosphatase Spo0E family protein [Neobacillus pocheonensis]|uniref:aspartyl-phosphate phosphatase Spo0E family protein n=1 Tax=Neobacillus pocheonensis TaxID=363869 RepID=UPI003D2CFEFD
MDDILNKPKITKEDVDRLAAEIEKDREELNRIGESCREIQNDLDGISAEVLALSQKLDEKIVKYTKLDKALKKIKSRLLN